MIMHIIEWMDKRPWLFYLTMMSVLISGVIQLPVMGGKLLFCLMSDAVILIFSLLLLLFLLKKGLRNLPFHLRCIGFLWGGTVFISVVLTAVRIFIGNTAFTTAIVSMKSGLLPVLLFAFLFLVNWSTDKLLRYLVLFNLSMNIIQFVLIVNQYTRHSSFMVNIMVFLTGLFILLPVNFKLLTDSNKKPCYIWFCWFNVISAIVFSVESGSRIAFFTIIYSLCLLIPIAGKQKIKFFWRSFFISVMVALAVIFMIEMKEKEYAVGNRAIIAVQHVFNSIMKAEEEPNVKITNPSLETKDPSSDENVSKEQIPNKNQEDYATTYISESDSFRKEAWIESLKRILESPLGERSDMSLVMTGLDNTIFYQSSHNFLLESALCFGIPGAVLFLIMFSVPLLYLIFKRKSDGAKRFSITFLFMLISVTAMFGVSTVQSVFFAPADTTIYWATIAVWCRIMGLPMITRPVNTLKE